MGFGHRVYKNGDSRVPDHARLPCSAMAALTGQTEWLEICDILETAMVEAKGI